MRTKLPHPNQAEDKMNARIAFCFFLLFLFFSSTPVKSADAKPSKIIVTINRGQDLGQSFGSLFEAISNDGQLVIGAGFQNAYNTRYRADRHALQFFIRSKDGKRKFTVKELPRPNNTLTGAYLFGRDGEIYSTEGGLKSWRPKLKEWQAIGGPGGKHETMRIGNGLLAFGSSNVTFNGKTILGPPQKGSYQLFFYANGHLCFYHVHRNGKGYRHYIDEEDGFSRLYACPWTPKEPKVDLSKAIALRLPVVGETTFAWGQLSDQIVTGSNIGGFYVFEKNRWRMILEPSLEYSYQLYSSLAFHDHLLMGQYPTGRVFAYDGTKITDLKGWPPVPANVSKSAREAQTTAVYGGELMVGVWPWGELWRHNPDSRQWTFMRRMYDHPAPSTRIVHPYDVENHDHSPRNLWGQRVTSLVANGPTLFIATSAKSPFKWEPKKFPFLAPDKWRSYGKVYQLTMSGHLSIPTRWTKGPTTFVFVLNGPKVTVLQDGKHLATTQLAGSLSKELVKTKSFKDIKWGKGIYGPFGGIAIKGNINGR